MPARSLLYFVWRMRPFLFAQGRMVHVVSLKQRFHAFFNPTHTDWQEQKANPAYSGLVAYGNAPQPVTMPRNYRSFAKEGYTDNTVWKCVGYISRNGGSIPPLLYTDETKQKKIEKHPLLDRLNKPNNEQSGVAYREACLAYKLISGNNFQYAIRAKNGPPDELWCLRPDRVAPIPDKVRGVSAYKYEAMDQPIAAENIGHTKYFNPDNPYFGMSPIEVAAILIDMQTGTRKWDLALVQNSARPSGAWTVPTALSLNDRTRLQQLLKEKLSGSRNAGVPPILDAGLTWQSMGLPPAELDWLESIKYNAILIANIYNMPPQLIGDTSSSTYNNMMEAKAASYTEAIFPDLDDLYGMWNNWLVPMYPDLKNSGAYLYYDKESVEVIQEMVQAQKTAQAQRAVQSYMQGACLLNEARVLQGLPEVPEGNVYRIGQVLIPADKLMEYALQSLTTPARAPQAIHEPVDANDPVLPQPGDEAPVPESMPPQKHYRPDYDEKELMYLDDSEEQQLAVLREQGVTHIQWLANSLSCERCQKNDRVIREVGSKFPSGNRVPVAHPHCRCVLKAVDKSKSAAYGEGYRPVNNPYREFMEATCR